MIKSTIFIVAPQAEKLYLHSWLLFIMLDKPLVDWKKTIGSQAAHHNRHRKHDQPTTPSHTNFRKISDPERSISIRTIPKQYKALNWRRLTLWYHCYKEGAQNNDTIIVFHLETPHSNQRWHRKASHFDLSEITTAVEWSVHRDQQAATKMSCQTTWKHINDGRVIWVRKKEKVRNWGNPRINMVKFEIDGTYISFMGYKPTRNYSTVRRRVLW